MHYKRIQVPKQKVASYFLRLPGQREPRRLNKGPGYNLRPWSVLCQNIDGANEKHILSGRVHKSRLFFRASPPPGLKTTLKTFRYCATHQRFCARSRLIEPLPLQEVHLHRLRTRIYFCLLYCPHISKAAARVFTFGGLFSLRWREAGSLARVTPLVRLRSLTLSCFLSVTLRCEPARAW